MFTGIVEEVGMVEGIRREQYVWKLRIKARTVCEGTATGDSIAVDGVCLTVIEQINDSFTVEVSAETRDRSTISGLAPGHRVNLERALTLAKRLGGHLVQGHVDTRGKITRVERAGDSVTLWVSVPSEWRKYLAAKGSVAIDGISLTVAEIRDDSFSIAVIPHTLAATTLQYKKGGDMVNIECDIIAKYVESLLTGKTDQTLSAQFLRERGFIS